MKSLRELIEALNDTSIYHKANPSLEEALERAAAYMKPPPINWGSIAKAERFYQEHGFDVLNVAWVVSPEAVAATLPINKSYDAIYKASSPHRHMTDWSIADCLVGSAEQSFIQLILDGALDASRRWQATTPCFRDELEDELHQPYFMKTELFAPARDSPRVIAETARNFFKNLRVDLVALQQLRVVETGEDMYDLLVGDIEIGSYGRRNIELPNSEVVSFVYGTGIAEPRTSIAFERSKQACLKNTP